MANPLKPLGYRSDAPRQMLALTTPPSTKLRQPYGARYNQNSKVLTRLDRVYMSVPARQALQLRAAAHLPCEPE
eukprot:5193736-Alexandrium_andersonii.AAC.1